MDVYSFYVKTRNQMTSASGKKPTRREVAEVVKDAIIEAWDRANLIIWSEEGEKTIIISEDRIVRNIESLAGMGLDLKKWSPGRKKGVTQVRSIFFYFKPNAGHVTATGQNKIFAIFGQKCRASHWLA